MVLVEDPGGTEYRGADYGFEIWNGILFPTDREHHPSLIKDYPCLISHPVLGKWLYLKADEPDFESVIDDLVTQISQNNVRFGIFPQVKSKKKKKTKKKKVTRKKSAKKKAKKS